MDGASGAELMLVRSCVCVRARAVCFFCVRTDAPLPEEEEEEE